MHPYNYLAAHLPNTKLYYVAQGQTKDLYATQDPLVRTDSFVVVPTIGVTGRGPNNPLAQWRPAIGRVLDEVPLDTLRSHGSPVLWMISRVAFDAFEIATADSQTVANALETGRPPPSDPFKETFVRAYGPEAVASADALIATLNRGRPE
jgi:hypothetical protein